MACLALLGDPLPCTAVLRPLCRSGEFHPEVEDELLAALRTTNDPEVCLEQCNAC